MAFRHHLALPSAGPRIKSGVTVFVNEARQAKVVTLALDARVHATRRPAPAEPDGPGQPAQIFQTAAANRRRLAG